MSVSVNNRGNEGSWGTYAYSFSGRSRVNMLPREVNVGDTQKGAAWKEDVLVLALLRDGRDKVEAGRDV